MIDDLTTLSDEELAREIVNTMTDILLFGQRNQRLLDEVTKLKEQLTVARLDQLLGEYAYLDQRHLEMEEQHYNLQRSVAVYLSYAARLCAEAKRRGFSGRLPS